MIYEHDAIGYIKSNGLIDENVFDLIELRLKKLLYFYGQHNKGSGQKTKTRYLLGILISLL